MNGKLKQEWANGGDSGAVAGSGITEQPFLWAIYKGNIETVKWFLSGEPLAKYKDYVRAHKYDDAFENVDGGYQKVLSSWWNSMRKSPKKLSFIFNCLFYLGPSGICIHGLMDGTRSLCPI